MMRSVFRPKTTPPEGTEDSALGRRLERRVLLSRLALLGERIIEAAKSDVRRMEEELDNLDRSRRTYLAQMRTLIARQLSEVEASDSQVVASTLRGAGSNSSASNRE